MIRFLVLNINRPPFRLGLLGVTFLTRGRTRRRLATVVRMLDLLSRFNELDECLGNLAAVNLLEVLQGALIVRKDFFSIGNFKTNHITRRRGRHLDGLGKLFFEKVVGGAAASDSTGVWPSILFRVAISIAHCRALEW